MYDSRIEAFLKTRGLRLETFYEAVTAADQAAGDVTRREERSLYSSLRRVHDFVAFSKMMQQRALESS